MLNSELSKFSRPKIMAKTLGVSISYLGDVRRNSLIEGFHFIKPTNNSVLFFTERVLDYFSNISTPHIHQAKVNQYLEDIKAS